MSNRRVTGHGAGLICSMPPFAGERDVLRGLMRRFARVRAEAAGRWEAAKDAQDRWGQCAELRLYVLAVRRCGRMKDLIREYFQSATGVSGGARPGGSSVTDADADLFRVDTASATGRVFFSGVMGHGSWVMGEEEEERRTA